MTRKTAKDFHPEVLKLFDQYVHGVIGRRYFLTSAARYAAVGVSASLLLESLSPQFASAQQVAADDKRLHADYVQFASPLLGYGTVRGYLAAPASPKGKLPTVLVVPRASYFRNSIRTRRTTTFWRQPTT
jgi:carboxymethylenebutenolidase